MCLLPFFAIISFCFNRPIVGKETPGNLEPLIQKTSSVLRISPIWLNELEQSYKFSFEHQFGLLKYVGNSTVPNHNTRHEYKSTCQNVSFLSIDQSRRLIDQFDYTFVLKSTIREMLDYPRARLFEFEDHLGEIEDYRFLWSKRLGTCTKLIQLNTRVKSVFTFGKCVRLFEKQECKGWSVVVYPGSSNSHRLLVPRHVTLKAIGPCLNNEFEAGFLNESIPGFVVKNPEMRSFQPDLVMMFNPDINLGRRKSFTSVNVKYLLGPGNRPEMIRAEHKMSTACQFSYFSNSIVQERSLNKMLEKEFGDVLGHAIPIIHNGMIANEAFNVFPANQSALDLWMGILCNYDYNRSISSYTLQFEYENVSTSRPLFFYYYIREDKNYNIEYGRIINGNQKNVRREKPYIQGIPKFQYKGTRTIDLTQTLERHRGTSKTMDFSSNASLVNVNKIAGIPLLIGQSCKYTNFVKDKELPETVPELLLLKAQIRGMVRNPMVRLYSRENLTGDSEDFHSGLKIGGYQRCHRIQKLRNVKSAETFGTCIRLYSGFLCEGLSLAIYGGSENSRLTLDTTLAQIHYVGPCIEDEFTNATFSDEIKRLVIKDRNSSSYFPDLVQFGGFTWDKEFVFKTRSEYPRNIKFGLGPKNRIEHIRTDILQIGPAELPKRKNVEKTEFYKLLDKKEGDVVCYAIPLKFYGPVDESFNIFPVSQSKVDDWTKIFPFLFDAHESLIFIVELHFAYGNVNSSRPKFVYYHFEVGTLSEEIYNGRFNNL